MKYAITLDPSIAKRNSWTGTRRRAATFADGSKKVLVFSRKPMLLDELPPEIAKDQKLLVKEVPSPASEPGSAMNNNVDDGLLDMPAPPPIVPKSSGKFTAKGKK